MMPLLITFRSPRELPGTLLGTILGAFLRFFVTLWRFLFGHAFQHVLKLNLACFLKDLGDYFYTLLEVLAIASGNVETLEFDDCFMKFNDFLMLPRSFFKKSLKKRAFSEVAKRILGIAMILLQF